MKHPLYNPSDRRIQHVILHLYNGKTFTGYIPPPFWVIRGMCKINCPQDTERHLAFIPEKYWQQHSPRFNAGEMLFSQLPEGYQEIPMLWIEKVEILTDNSETPKEQQKSIR